MTELALFSDAPRKRLDCYGRTWHIGELIQRGDWWLSDGIPFDADGGLTNNKLSYDYCLIHALDTELDARYWQARFQRAADTTASERDYCKRIEALLKLMEVA
jgi:hypothetical protein